MTDCPEQLTFDFHPRQAIVADFQGGLITSDAGLLPLRQLDQRLGWTAAVAEVLDDIRQAGKVGHDLLAIVRQRLFGLIAGYADANAHPNVHARGDQRLARGVLQQPEPRRRSCPDPQRRLGQL